MICLCSVRFSHVVVCNRSNCLLVRRRLTQPHQNTPWNWSLCWSLWKQLCCSSPELTLKSAIGRKAGTLIRHSSRLVASPKLYAINRDIIIIIGYICYGVAQPKLSSALRKRNVKLHVLKTKHNFLWLFICCVFLISSHIGQSKLIITSTSETPESADRRSLSSSSTALKFLTTSLLVFVWSS